MFWGVGVMVEKIYRAEVLHLFELGLFADSPIRRGAALHALVRTPGGAQVATLTIRPRDARHTQVWYFWHCVGDQVVQFDYFESTVTILP